MWDMDWSVCSGKTCSWKSSLLSLGIGQAWGAGVSIPPGSASPQMSKRQHTENKKTWLMQDPTECCQAAVSEGVFPCTQGGNLNLDGGGSLTLIEMNAPTGQTSVRKKFIKSKNSSEWQQWCG